MPKLTIDVAYPPSTNRIWRSGISKNGKPFVYRSPTYRKWLSDFWVMWLMQKPTGFRRIESRFRAAIILNPPRRSGDVNNRDKALLDAAQACGIIKDDSLCNDIHVWFGTAEEAPMGARLIIYPVDNQI